MMNPMVASQYQTQGIVSAIFFILMLGGGGVLLVMGLMDPFSLGFTIAGGTLILLAICVPMVTMIVGFSMARRIRMNIAMGGVGMGGMQQMPPQHFPPQHDIGQGGGFRN